MDISDDSEIVIKNFIGYYWVIVGVGGGMYGDGVGLYKGWGGKSFIDGGNGGELVLVYEKFGYGKMGWGGFGGGGVVGLLFGVGGGYLGGGVKGCWMECNGKEGGIVEGGSLYNFGFLFFNKVNKNKGLGRVYIRFMF